MPISLYALITLLAAIAIWQFVRIRKLQTSSELAQLKNTEQLREAKEQAAEITRKFVALMDACGNAVAAIDAKGVIVDVNESMCGLYSMPSSQLIANSLLNVTLSRALDERLTAAAQDAKSEPRRIRIDGPGGRKLRVSIRWLTDTSEKARPALLVFRDETKLRRLETVRQDFVANVSHELRTPLASIRAMAEALDSGAMDEPETAKRFLGNIISEADRLNRISSDLLTLSQAELEPPVKALFDLAQLAREVGQRYLPFANAKGIGLEVVANSSSKIFASSPQIEQVIINLLDNAIKYTSATGTITMRVEDVGEKSVLTVADTGIGILHEHLSRIFERFYRVDEARSRDTGGTGLGLSIVKHLSEANGGVVGVESVYNHGTTFRVEFDIATERRI